MSVTPEQLAKWRKRPYSWSQHSAWDYEPHQWFTRYVLGEKSPDSIELKLGREFADSCEARKPLAPVTIYKEVEHKIETTYGKMRLLKFLDSYDLKNRIAEYKTGKKAWDQKRVDQHGQLTFYALLLWLRDKKKPEDLKFILEWIPTAFREDYTFGLALDKEGLPSVKQFKTTRTMNDVLKLATEIRERRALMEAYVAART